MESWKVSGNYGLNKGLGLKWDCHQAQPKPENGRQSFCELKLVWDKQRKRQEN